MRRRKNRSAYVGFLLAVSIFGIAVSVSLLDERAPFLVASGERKILMASLYGFVCIAGILAVLFPVACTNFIRNRRSSVENLSSLEMRETKILGVSLLHGHHAPGPESVTHEFQIDGKTFCASCFGFLVGAILALITVVTFAVSSWSKTDLAYVSYGLGAVGVLFGLVQMLGLKARPRTRFIISAGFVSGTSLMLIGTDILTENLIADLLVVLLAVFWIISRVLLSDRSRNPTGA